MYKPGDTVPASGIYRVSHDPRHRDAHDVTCIAGKHFPPCKNCEHPRFVLKHEAIHIVEHGAFKH